jgi:hypothetical protein
MSQVNDNTGFERRLRIFLCHASQDKPQARLLYQQLKQMGFQPWLDEEALLPGQDWRQEIEKAVRTSDIVLVCLSNQSVSKVGFVQKEIRIALDAADEQPDGSIFIIPLKLEECIIPVRLEKWQWVNHYDEGGFEKLLCSLNKRSQDIGITPRKFDGLTQITADVLRDMINLSNSDVTANNNIKHACKLVEEGKLPIEFLTNFNHHRYWLVKKIAIEQIVKMDTSNTLDYLYEFRSVSYHVSQRIIIDYINRQFEEGKLTRQQYLKAVEIIEQLIQAPKVTEESKKKNEKFLAKLNCVSKTL